MEASVGFFINSSEDDSENEVTPTFIERKRLRDNSNVLDIPNKRFMRLFRVSKDLFSDILLEIEPYYIVRRNINAIPPILKLAATLRFLGKGSYQQGVGQDYLIGMAQSTVSIVMSETLDILENKLCGKHITFVLSNEEKQKSKDYFLNKTGFPGVIGCVDGTHINIIRPNKNEHDFFNRKGSHSLNVMITCDYNNKITSVDPRYGGCSHDSVIWSMSDNRKIMSQAWGRDNSSWILGDSGYSLEPWMMTPYRKTTEGSAESRFNTLHAKARSIIERAFGILKGRWRSLLHTRELHYQPEKVAKMVNVCCLLHNLCVKYNVPIDASLIVRNDDMDTQNAINEYNENLMQEAKRVRDNIRNQL